MPIGITGGGITREQAIEAVVGDLSPDGVSRAEIVCNWAIQSIGPCPADVRRQEARATRDMWPSRPDLESMPRRDYGDPDDPML